jgi:hypothetical protein
MLVTRIAQDKLRQWAVQEFWVFLRSKFLRRSVAVCKQRGGRAGGFSDVAVMAGQSL